MKRLLLSLLAALALPTAVNAESEVGLRHIFSNNNDDIIPMIPFPIIQRFFML